MRIVKCIGVLYTESESVHNVVLERERKEDKEPVIHKLALARLLTTVASLTITSPLPVNDDLLSKIPMRSSASSLG